jgi:hypothetical protein
VDNDGFGNGSQTTVSCNKPSGNWVQEGSKPSACDDCFDQNDNVFPGSTHCDHAGYLANGGISFDYNCDGNQLACSDFQKAGICAPDLANPGKCTGSGYIKANKVIQNPYCGSDTMQHCNAVSTGVDGGTANGCIASVSSANPITCK